MAAPTPSLEGSRVSRTPGPNSLRSRSPYLAPASPVCLAVCLPFRLRVSLRARVSETRAEPSFSVNTRTAKLAQLSCLAHELANLKAVCFGAGMIRRCLANPCAVGAARCAAAPQGATERCLAHKRDARRRLPAPPARTGPKQVATPALLLPPGQVWRAGLLQPMA